MCGDPYLSDNCLAISEIAFYLVIPIKDRSQMPFRIGMVFLRGIAGIDVE